MTDNELTYEILGSVFNVYNALGPGLLESVYEKVLTYELRKKGFHVENQIQIPIVYDGQVMGCDLRADIIVEDKVILEIKSVEEVKNVHFKQLLTYLRLTNKHIGYVINFNVADMKKGIFRKVNNA